MHWNAYYLLCWLNQTSLLLSFVQFRFLCSIWIQQEQNLKLHQFSCWPLNMSHSMLILVNQIVLPITDQIKANSCRCKLIVVFEINWLNFLGSDLILIKLPWLIIELTRVKRQYSQFPKNFQNLQSLIL